MSEELMVQDGQVVSMEYTLKVDGEVMDSSEGRGPLRYLHGSGNIIPGLESELAGMNVGDSKDVVVAAADGYGELDANAFMNVNRKQFPKDIPVKIGTELQVQNESGKPMYARIEEVVDENVRLNLNHPLAGKELHFAVKIVDVRNATDEEKQHGHAHDPDHKH